MKSKRQDKTDGKAGNGTQESHDSVEFREDNGDDDEDRGREQANGNLENAPGETG